LLSIRTVTKQSAQLDKAAYTGGRRTKRHPGDFNNRQANMMKIAILLTLTLIATEASAQYQSRTYYGPSGGVTGRSTTSSSGQSTFYGPSGSVIGRAAPSSNGTTASGGVTGHVTTSPSFRR
jgi:hypothetical protein